MRRILILIVLAIGTLYASFMVSFYKYASLDDYNNGFNAKATKADPAVMGVTMYTVGLRLEDGNHVYELIETKNAFRANSLFSYVDGKLIVVKINNEFVAHFYEPEKISRYEKDANKLLDTTRKRFCDVVPNRQACGQSQFAPG